MKRINYLIFFFAGIVLYLDYLVNLISLTEAFVMIGLSWIGLMICGHQMFSEEAKKDAKS